MSSTPEKPEDGSTKAQSTREGIIRAVQTPLGFFVLVVLIVEVMLGIIAGLSEGTDRTLAIVGSLALLAILILVVTFLACYRPGILQGVPSDGTPKGKPPIPLNRLLTESGCKEYLIEQVSAPDSRLRQLLEDCFLHSSSPQNLMKQFKKRPRNKDKQQDRALFFKGLGLYRRAVGEVYELLSQILPSIQTIKDELDQLELD